VVYWTECWNGNQSYSKILEERIGAKLLKISEPGFWLESLDKSIVAKFVVNNGARKI
jgi:hypothetical protein